MLLDMDWRGKLLEDLKKKSKYGLLLPEMQESMLTTSLISVKNELKGCDKKRKKLIRKSINFSVHGISSKDETRSELP